MEKAPKTYSAKKKSKGMPRGMMVAIIIIILIGAGVGIGFALNWGKSDSSAGPTTTRRAGTTTRKVGPTTRTVGSTTGRPPSTSSGYGCCKRQEDGCCSDDYCNRTKAICEDCSGTWTTVSDPKLINITPSPSSGCCVRKEDNPASSGPGCCGSDWFCNQNSTNCSTTCGGTWLPPTSTPASTTPASTMASSTLAASSSL